LILSNFEGIDFWCGVKRKSEEIACFEAAYFFFFAFLSSFFGAFATILTSKVL